MDYNNISISINNLINNSSIGPSCEQPSYNIKYNDLKLVSIHLNELVSICISQSILIYMGSFWNELIVNYFVIKLEII